ncbi:MAG: hypothetical protein H8E15_16615 [Planctomycetes bacterium]|nr:hypothetical protein [Planctomycetota bacterium]
MPSDNLTDLVLASLEGPRSAFASSLAAAAEQVRGTLAGLSADVDTRNNLLKTQLGGFAAGRINIEKFSTFADGQRSVNAGAVPTLKKAQAVLNELSDTGKDLIQIKVAAGKTVRCGVSRGLARIGRAFGAARCIELAKAGTYNDAEHGKMMEGLHFADWNQAERAMAPPVVVHVQGRSLHPSSLAEFMDGGVKIVLLIDGPCAPATLARLISPNTFVMQTQVATDLDRLAAWAGHGVAAIVPTGAAIFTYAPAGNTAFGNALKIDFAPEDASISPLGSLSAQQQKEDLAMLSALSGAATTPLEARDESPVNPVDQLAAFLLSKANIEEV